jgi:hypothetical protein
MTFNFPNTPTLGQTFAPADGPIYVWDGSAWRAIGPGAPATVRVGDTPPVNPVSGQLWWESDTGKLFIWYVDIDSSAWVHIFSGPKGDIGPAGVGIYDTKVGMAVVSVPGAVNAIRTNGYALAGDGGGALYKRVVGDLPAHAGKVQSMDGAWWELAKQRVNPQMFGAKANGVDSDSVALQAFFDFLHPADGWDADCCGMFILSQKLVVGVPAVKLHIDRRGDPLSGLLGLRTDRLHPACLWHERLCNTPPMGWHCLRCLHTAGFQLYDSG